MKRDDLSKMTSPNSDEAQRAGIGQDHWFAMRTLNRSVLLVNPARSA